MCGLYEPQGGNVEVNGHKLADFDPRSVRRSISYLPQEPILSSGSVLENLLLAETRRHRGRGPESAGRQRRRPGHRPASRWPPHRCRRARRISIRRSASANRSWRGRFLQSPKALILDEPTNALDTQSATVVIETLKRLAFEKTLIVITHNPGLLGENVKLINLSRAEALPSAETVPQPEAA